MTVTAAPVGAPAAPPIDYDTYGTIYEPKGPVADRPNVTGDNAYPFRGRITADGEFAAAPGRYHLFVSYACPFAHRTLIVRALKGLEDAIGVSVVDPLRDGRGWAFRTGSDLTLDTSGEGFRFLSEAYETASSGGYDGRVSVPVLWDTMKRTVVSNYYPDITIDLGGRFNAWADNPELDLYPADLASWLDDMNDKVFYGLNTGVYAAGFATNQEDYNQGAFRVFATLDDVEALLSDGRPYLAGDALTEADVRLWVTLVRFDPVYHGHFKLNRRRIVDYPHVSAYTARLYEIPAFGGTTKLDQITNHYYGTQRHLNPTGIIPVGPVTR